MVETITGRIIECRVLATRSSGPMAFAQIETDAGRVEAVLYPKIYTNCKSLLAKLGTLEFSGRLDVVEEGRKQQLIVETVRKITCD